MKRKPDHHEGAIMLNHAAYFNERAGKLVNDGIVTRETIDFYHALFEYHLRQYERYANDPNPPELESTDLPIAKTGKNIFLHDDALRLLLPGLAPLIELVATHHPGLVFRALSESLAADPGVMRDVTGALFENDSGRLGEFALKHKTGAEEAVFVVINWLKPFLVFLRGRNRHMIPGGVTKQRCPFCGYYPAMAAIISGKDGRRYLQCALCEHRWQYRRIACAVCGSEEAKDLEYLSSETDARYRIDVCHECRGYIKTVRIESAEELDECDLAVENVLTPHLDSAALRQGFRRP
ncbi:MAG: hypothetical protein A2176_10435 [Spirochaetes bacterium RBG_13_51_14]|nr:MAG: hypothetical protein A2176_10435 [Spirochaetes bacterium RBG_13_51_14]